MKVFVTGATGFVGKALINELLSAGHNIVAGVRNYSVELPLEVEQQQIGDLSLLSEQNSVIDTLKKVEVVIHTAARVHIMQDNSADPLSEFRKMNVNATLSLAKQAFRETDKPAPEDAYGQSKFEAEQLLFEIGQTTPMEVVVIRPPIIYGPGVKANFASMIKIIKKGIPLPFGSISNQRSMLAIHNLVNFITLCTMHPAAANEVFLIADGEDVSTTDMLKKIAKAYKRPIRLIPVPVFLMIFIAKLTNKNNISDRLFGNLQIDITKSQHLLGWKPVVSMEQQLNKMAELDKNST
jgi:nucleoside-diphosphate-sugar epimerase